MGMKEEKGAKQKGDQLVVVQKGKHVVRCSQQDTNQRMDKAFIGVTCRPMKFSKASSAFRRVAIENNRKEQRRPT